MPENRGRFTMATDPLLMGLETAGASGTETRVYLLLTRHHNGTDHPSRCWLSAQYASDVLGIRQDVVSRALRNLCKKVFTTDEHANPVTVLTRVKTGGNGRAATYEDNLFRLTELERSYPHARQDGPPTSEVARQDGPPTSEVARQDGPPTSEVARQDGPPTSDNRANSCKAKRTDLQGNSDVLHGNTATPADKEELLESQPNKQGVGTEECTSKVDSLVSESAAPLDSYGMTAEEREEHYSTGDWIY